MIHIIHCIDLPLNLVNTGEFNSKSDDQNGDDIVQSRKDMV